MLSLSSSTSDAVWYVYVYDCVYDLCICVHVCIDESVHLCELRILMTAITHTYTHTNTHTYRQQIYCLGQKHTDKVIHLV